MDKLQEKREVPGTLKKLLAVDSYLTDVFTKEMERILAFHQLNIHCRTLEISCHGIPWIAVWLAFIWIINSKSLYQMQVNFLIGLLIDILVVAVLKSVARRRRPTTNDDPFGMGPDKYSFPSGHASRSAFIVYFFINLWPVHFVFVPPLLAWSAAVSVSRVLDRKHYLLDIIFGIVLGILLGIFLSFIYLNEDTCLSLVSWISDEKLEGGEYHV